MTAGQQNNSGRILALVVAAVLVMLFFALDETGVSLSYKIMNGFSFSAPAQSLFWLAHAMLLAPAACLAGYGLAPFLAPRLATLAERIDALDRREKIASAILIGFMGALLARLNRALFLLDYPVTDDEWAVRFGGQVLANGYAAAPRPELYELMPHLFAWTDGARVSSFDWPGGQVAMMIAELGAGPWFHAILAATPMVALAVLFARRLSPRWGALAIAFFAFSPMAFALSMTMHAHLISRAFIAIGITCFALATWGWTGRDNDRAFSKWLWFGCGLAFGLSFASRPYETSAAALPLVGWLVWQCRSDPAARQALLWAVLGGALPLLLFAWQNHELTGKFWVTGRSSGQGFGSPGIARGGLVPDTWRLLWNRFGANLSYNLFMLSIWFLGPLGVVLTVAGANANRLTRLLLLGLGFHLLIAIFHDNHGVHVVGPIHYSEAVVPLTVIAVFGAHRIHGRIKHVAPAVKSAASAVVLLLVLGLGTFNLWHGFHLQDSATMHATIYGVVDDEEVPRSVVLVPHYSDLWHSFPRFAAAGGWVFDWRHNHPTDERVLLIRDVPGAAHLAAEHYPKRALLRLIRVDKAPGLALVPVDLSVEPPPPPHEEASDG